MCRAIHWLLWKGSDLPPEHVVGQPAFKYPRQSLSTQNTVRVSALVVSSHARSAAGCTLCSRLQVSQPHSHSHLAQHCPETGWNNAPATPLYRERCFSSHGRFTFLECILFAHTCTVQASPPGQPGQQARAATPPVLRQPQHDACQRLNHAHSHLACPSRVKLALRLWSGPPCQAARCTASISIT